MVEVDKDLKLILEYYVGHQSEKEEKFIRMQKQCQVKLSISVSHSNCSSAKEENDLLIIHTKLIQMNKEKSENAFYIKSQSVSHCTGLTHHHNIAENHKIMSIETVITRDNSQCETVFMTFIRKDENGKRTKIQRSYTREITDCQHSNNCEDSHDKYKAIFSDSEDENNSKPAPKLEPQVFGKPPKSQGKSQRNFKKFFKLKLPFPKIFPSEVQSPTSIKPFLGSKKLSLTGMQSFSTENDEMKNKKPNNVMAKISVYNKTHTFKLIEDDKEDIPFMDEEDNNECVEDSQQLMVDSNPYVHFDFATKDDINHETTNFFDGATCDCEKKRITAITKYLESKIAGKPDNLTTIIDKFDEKTRHFSDCRRISLKHSSSSFLSPISGTLSASLNSVFLDNLVENSSNFSTLESNLNMSRKSSIIGSVEHLNKVLEDLKLFNEIQCSMKEVKYFKNLSKYETYEKKMLKIFGQNPTLESFALFLFMTRSIVQHIDDPSLKNNENINNIIKFANNFLQKFYSEKIKSKGGIENFLRSGNLD